MLAAQKKDVILDEDEFSEREGEGFVEPDNLLPELVEEIDDAELESSVNELLKTITHSSLNDEVYSDAEDEGDEESRELESLEVEAEELTLDSLMFRQQEHLEDWVEFSKDVGFTSDLSSLYMRDVTKVSLLKAHEEVSLGERFWNGDEHAGKLLVLANLRLPIHIAKKFLPTPGMSLLDLASEGNLGLMEAAKRFNPFLGFRFSTYATWWIRQSIQRAVAYQSRGIRLPVHVIQLQRKLYKIEQKANASGVELCDEQICVLMDISQEKLESIRNTVDDAISLSSPVGEDGSILEDLIDDSGKGNPFHKNLERDASSWLKEGLSRLTEKERYVIDLRFGSSEAGGLTLEEVGSILGVTRERVRQIESQSLRKLRYFLRLKGLSIKDVLPAL